MKYYFILSLLVHFTNSGFSQKENITVESLYNFTLQGGVEELPPGINSDITVKASIKVIRNEKYCALIIVQSSLENPVLSEIAHSENDGDTLFFDIKQKRIYNIAEKKSYWFTTSTISFLEPSRDTIKKEDTLIALSKKINKYVSPSPTLGEMQCGVLYYAAKGFSFKYTASQKSNISLEAIFNRCKNFIYTGQKTEFAY